ncbi:TLC domain-containing protein 2-like [Gigantopelta aegis]|uniref:TLC domain-containing protein 2-like n=1 Tax=Gigantopelta aegis TaxID=1735272 RepID=UPI001B88A704|nr:TLC domain-containing protein 2-like [Gigantopelta aegis]
MAIDALGPQHGAGLGVDRTWGYIATFSSILLFAVFSLVIRISLPALNIKGDPWRWSNLFISMIHALVCSVWNLSCFFLYPDQFVDRIDGGNAYMYFLITFATGYFTYDVLDIIFNKKLQQTWEVMVHHFAVLTVFWYNMHMMTCIPYSLIALLTEVNTVFLHCRKLYQMSRCDLDHWTYRLLVTVNIVTFAVFRGIALGWITYGLTDGEQNVRISVVYYRCLWMSMMIMNVINPIFFWKLLKSDFLRKRNKTPVDKVISNGTNTKTN